jgi:hypothetical protein
LFVTPFFYSQSLFAALCAVPAMLLIGATLEVLARPPSAAPSASPSSSASPSASKASWAAPIGRGAKLLLQGIPLAALLFVLFPRLAAPLWGLPTDRAAY